LGLFSFFEKKYKIVSSLGYNNLYYIKKKQTKMANSGSSLAFLSKLGPHMQVTRFGLLFNNILFKIAL
jgi:hypothetical protein